jgi:hypothetical protein
VSSLVPKGWKLADLIGEVGDIRLSEIGLLLRDYRRLAGVIESLKKAEA